MRLSVFALPVVRPRILLFAFKTVSFRMENAIMGDKRKPLKKKLVKDKPSTVVAEVKPLAEVAKKSAGGKK